MTEIKAEEADGRRRPDSLLDAAGQLTLSDINAFLVAMGAKPQCPSCGVNDWQVHTPSGDGVVSFVMQPADSLGSIPVRGAAVPSFLMVCNRCGFVRPHAALTVANWKLDQDPA